ncbi:MAG: NUDIX domain-containing protein [Chitinophagales bacterium]|nr:NUDIX domain-containing protein [Chitinophagales bacterium]MDW8428021.1 NUDIX domain-containing protein [Chitinophagales bacterium]
MSGLKHNFSTKAVSKLVVRVYGICIHEDQWVLLADEQIGNFQVTKFPGGGLMTGEGIADCLRREWLEETGTAVKSFTHLYTTDFFVQSAFDPSAQVICVYYIVTFEGHLTAIRSDVPRFSGRDGKTLRWHPLPHLKPPLFHFKTDQVACSIFLQKFRE